MLGASSDPLLLADPDVPQRLASVPAEEELPTVGAVSVGIPSATALPRAVASSKDERRSNPRPHSIQGPRFFELSFRVGALVAFVATLGITAGALGLVFGTTREIVATLSAHSLPVDADWLRHLLQPFSRPRVAGVYGRQLPRSNATPLELIGMRLTGVLSDTPSFTSFVVTSKLSVV